PFHTLSHAGMNANSNANVTKPSAKRTISHVVKLIRTSPASPSANQEIREDLSGAVMSIRNAKRF
ncbi:MAG: hypothetical protein ACLP9L_04025, partial [Thermoguttaceae bacterium]